MKFTLTMVYPPFFVKVFGLFLGKRDFVMVYGVTRRQSRGLLRGRYGGGTPVEGGSGEHRRDAERSEEFGARGEASPP
jgi:hypothetical protein